MVLHSAASWMSVRCGGVWRCGVGCVIKPPSMVLHGAASWTFAMYQSVDLCSVNAWEPKCGPVQREGMGTKVWTCAA
eukprot:365660-Chlamydomonas_euryale.AAC.3